MAQSNYSIAHSPNANYSFGQTIDSDTSQLNAPPTPETWDYAEMTLLIVLFLIGAPLNLISLVRALNTNRTPQQKMSDNLLLSNLDFFTESNSSRPFSASSQLTLRLHLTIANLITVWVYGLSEIFWLATYSWRGGDLLCRVVQFLYTFCFYATSNLTASIALDRLCAPLDHRKHRSWYFRLLHSTVWISWILAFLSSVPQVFVWKTFTPYPNDWPDWNQCVSVWTIAKHEQMVNVIAGNSSSFVNLKEIPELLYNGFHLAFVFWIPATIIVFSYVCIVTKLQRTIKDTKIEIDRRCRLQKASNAAMFRHHACNLHHLGLRSSTDNKATSPKTRAQLRRKSRTKSPILLMELPIVLRSPQAFVCQPLLESYALMALVRTKRRTVRKTAYILLAYILCWSPYNILALGRYIDASFENNYLEVLSNLIVLNAVINPLIYGV